jgi:hypothetical protein
MESFDVRGRRHSVPLSNSDPGAMGESKFIALKNCNYAGDPQILIGQLTLSQTGNMPAY